jgi:hypothetical protein
MGMSASIEQRERFVTVPVAAIAATFILTSASGALGQSTPRCVPGSVPDRIEVILHNTGSGEFNERLQLKKSEADHLPFAQKEEAIWSMSANVAELTDPFDPLSLHVEASGWDVSLRKVKEQDRPRLWHLEKGECLVTQHAYASRIWQARVATTGETISIGRVSGQEAPCPLKDCKPTSRDFSVAIDAPLEFVAMLATWLDTKTPIAACITKLSVETAPHPSTTIGVDAVQRLLPQACKDFLARKRTGIFIPNGGIIITNLTPEKMR